ncbi:MAG: hypothetical protein ACOY3P_09385 [Planctomycetota bacterium]
MLSLRRSLCILFPSALLAGALLSVGCQPTAQKPEQDSTPATTAPDAAPATDEAPSMAEPSPAEPAEPAATEPAESAAPAEPMPAAPGTSEPAAPAEPATPPEPTAESPAPAAATVAVDPDKVSTFAPADNLTSQMDEYLADLEKVMADETAFNDAQIRLSKDVNTAIIIALSLGMHDEDNKYKAKAGDLVKALQAMAAAEGFEATKKAHDDVKAAVTGAGSGTELKWEKVASLPELMKAVPLINTRLKRNVQSRTFERRAEENAGASAVLAAIAHASIVDLSEADTPEKVDQWKNYCVQMRDAAAVVNAGIRQRDQSAVEASMPALAKSCDDCHAVFHPTATTEGAAE